MPLFTEFSVATKTPTVAAINSGKEADAARMVAPATSGDTLNCATRSIVRMITRSSFGKVRRTSSIMAFTASAKYTRLKRKKELTKKGARWGKVVH